MKIIGIVGNYPLKGMTEHNISTFGSFLKKEVMVYTVPDTALLRNGNPFFIPDFATDCAMELHLVARICRLGRCISPRFAHRYYDALTVGISFTARQLLEETCKAGGPWDVCKGFDGAAPVGDFVEKEVLGFGYPHGDLSLRLEVDGKVKLVGRTSEMENTIDELIAYVSRFYTLRQGDLLFTGASCESTVAMMDTHVDAYLEDRRLLSFNIK